jgi:hypothetical protein
MFTESLAASRLQNPDPEVIDEKSGDATAPVDRSKGTPGWDPTRARPVIGRTEGSDELY